VHGFNMVKAASLGKTDADVTGRQSQKKDFFRHNLALLQLSVASALEPPASIAVLTWTGSLSHYLVSDSITHT